MSSALPPASATTNRSPSRMMPTGLESIAGLPTALSGLTARSKAQMSASGSGLPCGPISRTLPNRFAARFWAASVSREIVAPVVMSFGSVGPPLVITTVSVPSTRMPCGPIALSRSGVFDIEGSPATMRDWRPRRSTLVTAPVAPSTRDLRRR